MVMLCIKLKGIKKCSNMVANILTADPPPPPRPLGSKGQTNQLFQNNIMLHINLKGITSTANILPGDGVNWSKFYFSEHGPVAYQIKGNHKMQQYGCKYFARSSLTTLGVKRSKLNFFRTWSCCILRYGQLVEILFSEHGPVAYQIKGNHKMQQYGCKYFARSSLTTLGVKRSKLNFFRTWSCCILK